MFRLTKEAVFELLKKYPGGLSKERIQNRLGVTRPDDEDQRKQVWAISAALASLKRERVINSAFDTFVGRELYFVTAS